MIVLIILLSLMFPEQYQDGTLIFVEHSSKIVENETGSPITHVGIILDGYVYEAVKPKVHKITVEEFYKKRKKFSIITKAPKQEYNQEEIKKLKDYLNDQIGRKYSVMGYINEQEVKGIHCSELVSNALSATGRYKIKEPWKITPAKLYDLNGY